MAPCIPIMLEVTGAGISRRFTSGKPSRPQTFTRLVGPPHEAVNAALRLLRHRDAPVISLAPGSGAVWCLSQFLFLQLKTGNVCFYLGPSESMSTRQGGESRQFQAREQPHTRNS